ncbi:MULTISPECIES: tRNA threonylcarbamoyladenosine dehydratase [Methylotenera]|uniref:tRNA threonylcarbamoyladenosine dehydratase n=1 Tax=Methylotenera TaxID=359407 RepID=UPI00037AC864|nr:MULTISPECIES: tRNA threonylcarbamoyladenosine dehydratase [Methylotenera]
MTGELDFERRFGGVKRLYGEAGLKKLNTAHAVVIGIGGVGSWAAEALARNAVGTITLIDLDNIAESNVNRQLHAVDGAFGQAKVSAMRERILSINPLCNVREIEDFITTQNITTILSFECDVILDCIDDAQAKIALADFCKRKQIPLIMAGSAGGRLDPTRIQVADLAHVTGDRLLSKVRNQLRRDYAFPKVLNTKKPAKFGIDCVFSDEQAIKPDSTKASTSETEDACEVEPTSITGLNCAGYGSSVCVTAPFGFTAAQLAINYILL